MMCLLIGRLRFISMIQPWKTVVMPSRSIPIHPLLQSRVRSNTVRLNLKQPVSINMALISWRSTARVTIHLSSRGRPLSNYSLQMLLPGSYVFWSNQGDISNPTLTREFDLSGVSGAVEMSYQTWYSIEEDWDYVYVEASINGEDWTILDTQSCTTNNPTGNSYGCGYTGQTGGWIRESVDLSEYAGEKVLVRFDYITDTAVHEEGLLLDDIRVDAIDYFTDFEQDDDGWVADGFVRVENILPQTYRVTMIRISDGTTVESVALDQNMYAQVPFSINSRNDKVVFIISGTTRFTTQLADYSFSIND